MTHCYCDEPSFFYLRSRKENEYIIQEKVNKCNRLQFTNESGKQKLSKKQPCDFLKIDFYKRLKITPEDEKPVYSCEKVQLNYRDEIDKLLFRYSVNEKNEYLANSCISNINYYLNILGYKPIRKETILKLKERLSKPPDKIIYKPKPFVSVTKITDPFIESLLTFKPPKVTKRKKCKPKKNTKFIFVDETEYNDYYENKDEENSDESEFELDVESEEDSEQEEDIYISDGGDFSD